MIQKRLNGDQSLLGFTRAFYKAYHAKPYEELRPYLNDDYDPRSLHALHNRHWDGWWVEDLGELIVVTPMGNADFELRLPNLRLTNARGDLWEHPTGLLMRSLGRGRFIVLFLGDGRHFHESRQDWRTKLEGRLADFAHQREIARRIEEARSAPAPALDDLGIGDLKLDIPEADEDPRGERPR